MKDRIPEIIRLYDEEWLGITAIGRRLRAEPSYVRGVLDGAGVARRFGPSKFVDHRFFSVIDTEEKAYWLGYIAADGSLHEHGALSITSADGPHLRKFKKALQAEQKIHRMKTAASPRPWSIFSVKHEQLAVDLMRLGIHPRKSRSIAPPPNDAVPRTLLRHYWRGYVDGDGHIAEEPTPTLRFGSLSEMMAEAWHAYAVQNVRGLAPTPKMLCHGKSRDEVRYDWRATGNNAALAIRHLYSESTVHLDRKKKIADAIVGDRFK